MTNIGRVPGLQEIRKVIDQIDHRRDSILLKSLYLTAARVSELAKYNTPHDRSRGLQAYGSTVEWAVQNVKVDAEDLKALIINLTNIHRKKKNRRIIALPLQQGFEPWAMDLAEYIIDTEQLHFPITRHRIWQIVRKRLGALDPGVHPHSLRHWRITHLISLYGFDAYDVTIFAGWTFQTGVGVGAGSMFDVYAHLNWQKYFPKLCRKVG